MAIRPEGGPARTPWHLWVVSLIGLCWNGFGGYDYYMTHTAGDTYMRSMGMTEPQIAYLNGLPGWMTVVWAVGVWGAVLGTILLLLRSRWAVGVFGLSLAALLLSIVNTHLLSNGGALMGTTGIVMNIVLTAAAVAFLYYASRMRSQGVLR